MPATRRPRGRRQRLAVGRVGRSSRSGRAHARRCARPQVLSAVFSPTASTMHGVATDQCQRRVPAPDGHGKVEGGYDAAQTQRVPVSTHGGALGARRLWSGRRAGVTDPTAKSQMSIISCTSPRPSCRILPDSSDTRRPRPPSPGATARQSRRTSSPRRGAGTSRHIWKASKPAAIIVSMRAGETASNRAISLPSMGVVTARSPIASSA